MNALKGWRTVIINGAILVGMLAAAVTGQITDPNILRSIVIVQSIANVLLRFLTDSKVGVSVSAPKN